MTVSSAVNKIWHNGNSVAVAFTFPYRVLDKSHLQVYVKTASTDYVLRTVDGVGTYDYAVSGVGDVSGVTVTFNTAPPTVTNAILIVRTVPLTQISDYVNGDEFPMEVLENDLDKATMGLQQLDERITRCLLLARTASAYSAALPDPTPSALLAAKADGTGFQWVTPLSFGALSVTAYILGLLDDVDAPAARTTLGVAAALDGSYNRPKLQSARESFASASVSGTVVVNLDTATYHALTLTGSITTLTIQNAPASEVVALTLEIIQGGSGSYAITWPGTVKWSGSTPPTLTTTVGKTDIITLVTRDGGANWLGFVAGQNY